MANLYITESGMGGMSIPTHALAARVPGELHDDANRLAWATGYQDDAGDTFSIALSDGSFAFVQWVSASFLALLAGPVPAGVPWADFGLTAQRAGEVLAALEIVAAPAVGTAGLPQHFAAALDAWDVSSVELA